MKISSTIRWPLKTQLVELKKHWEVCVQIHTQGNACQPILHGYIVISVNIHFQANREKTKKDHESQLKQMRIPDRPVNLKPIEDALNPILIERKVHSR